MQNQVPSPASYLPSRPILVKRLRRDAYRNNLPTIINFLYFLKSTTLKNGKGISNYNPYVFLENVIHDNKVEVFLKGGKNKINILEKLLREFDVAVILLDIAYQAESKDHVIKSSAPKLVEALYSQNNSLKRYDNATKKYNQPVNIELYIDAEKHFDGSEILKIARIIFDAIQNAQFQQQQAGLLVSTKQSGRNIDSLQSQPSLPTTQQIAIAEINRATPVQIVSGRMHEAARMTRIAAELFANEFDGVSADLILEDPNIRSLFGLALDAAYLEFSRNLLDTKDLRDVSQKIKLLQLISKHVLSYEPLKIATALASNSLSQRALSEGLGVKHEEVKLPQLTEKQTVLSNAECLAIATSPAFTNAMPPEILIRITTEHKKSLSSTSNLADPTRVEQTISALMIQRFDASILSRLDEKEFSRLFGTAWSPELLGALTKQYSEKLRLHALHLGVEPESLINQSGNKGKLANQDFQRICQTTEDLGQLIVRGNSVEQLMVATRSKRSNFLTANMVDGQQPSKTGLSAIDASSNQIAATANATAKTPEALPLQIMRCGVRASSNLERELILSIAETIDPRTESTRLQLAVKTALRRSRLLATMGIDARALNQLSINQLKKIFGPFITDDSIRIAIVLVEGNRLKLINQYGPISGQHLVGARDLKSSGDFQKLILNPIQEIESRLNDSNLTLADLDAATNSPSSVLSETQRKLKKGIDSSFSLKQKRLKKLRKVILLTQRMSTKKRPKKRKRIISPRLQTPVATINPPPLLIARSIERINVKEKQKLKTYQAHLLQHIQQWERIHKRATQENREKELKGLANEYKEGLKKIVSGANESAKILSAIGSRNSVQRLATVINFEITKQIEALFVKAGINPLYVSGISTLPKRILSGIGRVAARASAAFPGLVLKQASTLVPSAISSIATGLKNYCISNRLISGTIKIGKTATGGIKTISKTLLKVGKSVLSEFLKATSSLPALGFGLLGGLVGNAISPEAALIGTVLGNLSGAAIHFATKKLRASVKKKLAELAARALSKLVKSLIIPAMKALWGIISAIGSALASALAALLSSLGAPVVVGGAVIILIVVGIFFLFGNNLGLPSLLGSNDNFAFLKNFGVGGGDPFTQDNSESEYLKIEKIAEPDRLKNTELPQTITYTITLSLKGEYIIKNFTIEENVTTNSVAETNAPIPNLKLIKVNGEERSSIPNEIDSDLTLIYETKKPLNSQYIDTRVTNTIIFKGDVYGVAESQPTINPTSNPPPPDEEATLLAANDEVSATANVEIGKPPIIEGCWPASGLISQFPFGEFSHGPPGNAKYSDAYDIATNVQVGRPLYAPFDGVVSYGINAGGPTQGFGYYAVLKTSVTIGGLGGRSFLMGHLLERGGGSKSVKRGDKIGLTGNTGWSSGPHVHYEVDYNANGAWYSCPSNSNINTSTLRKIMKAENFSLWQKVTSCGGD